MPLARTPFADLPDQLRPAWESSMDRAGEAGFIEVGASAPAAITWYSDEFYGRLFNGGRVDARSKELLRLRFSKTHGCWY